MFIDEAMVYVKAGDGGDGVISFRREKFIARGGPDGGHGGDGGSIIFIADENLDTLQDFSHKRHYRAVNGKSGAGSNCTGKKGCDLILQVPLGTMIFEQAVEIVSSPQDNGMKLSSHRFVCDLDRHLEQVIVAKGGRGGKGNSSFAHSLNQAPRLAEKGEKGEEKSLILELKILADIGLVGFPNAGKSTLLGKISRTQPKIGDYPFTTLLPQLGKHYIPLKKPFTIADIPGIIEGASQGKGLGIQFLKHIERCRMLLFLLDFNQEDPAFIQHQLQTLFEEVQYYNPDLKEKTWVICGNKMDTTLAKAIQTCMEPYFNSLSLPYFYISGKTGENVSKLMEFCSEQLEKIPFLPSSDNKQITLYTLQEKRIHIEKMEEHLYRVQCPELERIVSASDMHHPGSLRYISRLFKKVELEKLLRKHGIMEGDMVEIAGKRMIWT